MHRAQPIGLHTALFEFASGLSDLIEQKLVG
jgi:hypothetical protein